MKERDENINLVLLDKYLYSKSTFITHCKMMKKMPMHTFLSGVTIRMSQKNKVKVLLDKLII